MQVKSKGYAKRVSSFHPESVDMYEKEYLMSADNEVELSENEFDLMFTKHQRYLNTGVIWSTIGCNVVICAILGVLAYSILVELNTHHTVSYIGMGVCGFTFFSLLIASWQFHSYRSGKRSADGLFSGQVLYGISNLALTAFAALSLKFWDAPAEYALVPGDECATMTLIGLTSCRYSIASFCMVLVSCLTYNMVAALQLTIDSSRNNLYFNERLFKNTLTFMNLVQFCVGAGVISLSVVHLQSEAGESLLSFLVSSELSWFTHTVMIGGVVLSLFAIVAMIGRSSPSCVFWMSTLSMICSLAMAVAAGFLYESVVPNFFSGDFSNDLLWALAFLAISSPFLMAGTVCTSSIWRSQTIESLSKTPAAYFD